MRNTGHGACFLGSLGGGVGGVCPVMVAGVGQGRRGAGFQAAFSPGKQVGVRQPQVIGWAGHLSRLLGDLSARFREGGLGWPLPPHRRT